QITVDLFVQIGSVFHAIIELAFESRLFYLLGCIVTVHRGEVLPLLSENTVPVKVSVQTEISENVERVIDVLECPSWFVAPMPALVETLYQFLFLSIAALFFNEPAKLLE